MVGAHATSLTQSPCPVNSETQFQLPVSFEKSQILTRQSEPPVTILLNGAEFCCGAALVTAPAETEGAQETELTPMP